MHPEFSRYDNLPALASVDATAVVMSFARNESAFGTRGPDEVRALVEELLAGGVGARRELGAAIQLRALYAGALFRLAGANVAAIALEVGRRGQEELDQLIQALQSRLRPTTLQSAAPVAAIRTDERPAVAASVVHHQSRSAAFSTPSSPPFATDGTGRVPVAPAPVLRRDDGTRPGGPRPNDSALRDAASLQGVGRGISLTGVTISSLEAPPMAGIGPAAGGHDELARQVQGLATPEVVRWIEAATYQAGGPSSALGITLTLGDGVVLQLSPQAVARLLQSATERAGVVDALRATLDRVSAPR